MTAATLENGLRVCECHVPNPMPNKPATCVRCGYALDPDWTCSAQTTRAFLRRLEEANPGAGESFERFEAQILRRQKAGEKTFQQTFHGRDNLTEASEELCDLALYAALHTLVERRAGRDEEMDIALEVAGHAAKAYELLEVWRSKTRGASGPAHDDEEEE